MDKDPLSQTTLEMAEVGDRQLAASDVLALTGAVVGAPDAGAVLQRITAHMVQRLDATSIGVLLAGGQRGRDLIWAASSDEPDRRGQRFLERQLSFEVQAVLDRGLDWALGRDDPLDPSPAEVAPPPILRGTLTEPSPHDESSTGLIVPLVNESKVVGILWVGSAREGLAYPDWDLALVQCAAGYAAQAAGKLAGEREQREEVQERSHDQRRLFEKLEVTNARLRDIIEGTQRELSICAHDMRAPIGVIQGHVSVLERGVEEAQVARSLSAIGRQGDRLLSMVDDLLGGNRKRALGLRLEACDLNPWFRSCASDFGFLAQKEGVELKADVSTELGIRRIDTDAIEEILGNLLENAIKYSGRGGRVELTVDELSGEQLRIEVVDSGPGLSDDVLEHGFRLYYRDHESGPISGAGVGLASVLELVHALGGQIEARNHESGGAQFTLVIPAYVDALAADDTNPIPVQQFRVLLVQSSDAALTELTRYLSHRFEVVGARSEREALWLMQQGPIDCAVVDLNPPLMTGFATAAELRRDPDRNHLPVLFTADGDLGGVTVRRRAGALEDVIVRPIEADELVRKVSLAINDSVERSMLVRTGRTDPLSGLMSRKFGEPEVDRELTLSRERETDLTMLLLDLDHMHAINANGHEADGDAVIRYVGRTLKQSTRSGELCARWGGDEFLCLLPGTSGEQARVVAERIAKRLRGHIAGGRPLTASIGVATSDPADDEIEALGLVERARAALEVARDNGGDRVAMWERRPRAPMPDVGAMGKHLLIVDDDREVLETLAVYFSRTTNLVVDTATSADDAVRKANRTPPQVVIVDLGLPDSSGFDLLRRLREGSNPSLPAIAYTGETDLSTIDRTEEAGFNACLTKTARLDHLADEVNRWLL